MNARYDSHTYFVWLIERRDTPQPMWWAVDCTWTTNANGALWFARESDAQASAGECQHDVKVCEHGFMLDAPAKSRAANSFDALTSKNAELSRLLDEQTTLALTNHTNSKAQLDALTEANASLLADAERYRRIRYCRKFVGMLETATMHCETDAEYDEAVDGMPAPKVAP